MDKSWIFNPDRLSHEYEVGVDAFLEFAKKSNPKAEFVPCPCITCANVAYNSYKTVRLHIFSAGFDESYMVWSFHGEKRPDSIPSDPKSIPSDPKFIPPIPPDFQFTRDILHDAFTYVEEDPNLLKDLLEECEKPLYEGSKYNSLSGLLKFQHIKGQFGWSDASFEVMLAALKDVLPPNNTIPNSLYEAKKLLKGVGLECTKFHSCENDCIIYFEQHKDATQCPTCGTSRWKEKTNIPNKVFWYFPPIPRFTRMFSSPQIANDLTWHSQGPLISGKLSHPRDSPSWKHVDNTWKAFGKEKRNLRLALSADGINPHKTLSSKHSCWPVSLVTYNLPSHLCMTRKFMMLTLLISGPKQPGNNIDVYLAPLIADLKLLWEDGVKTYDAYRKEYFNLRAILLWTINDFPGYGDLSGCVTKGYFACPICAENTCSQWLPNSKKVCYLGHRRFLPVNHSFRKRKKDFNNQSEGDIVKRPSSGEEIFEYLEGFKTVWGRKITPAKKFTLAKMTTKKKTTSKKAPAKKKTPKKKKPPKVKEVVDPRAQFWHKKSIFFELEYWKKLLIRHQLDLMHIEKNVCEKVYGTLLNLPGKTKDGIKARKDLVVMGIKPELHPQKKGTRDWLPPACYTLNTEEKHRFYETLSNIKVPQGYSSNFKKLVSADGSKMNGLKSNDCHVLMQQVLPFAIKGVLDVKVRKAIISLCHFFNDLCSKVIDVTKLNKLQNNIVITLCLLEKYFPPSFFDIMIHLMVHLVQQVRLCGPIYFLWMYPFERYMKTLKGYVRNHTRPEGCIATCYVAEEALEFWSDYIEHMKSIGNPHERIDERIRTGKSLSKGTITSVDAKILDEAHLYVLRNTAVVEPYIEQHMMELKSLNLRKSRNSQWLQSQHSQTFINWLNEEVEKRVKNGEDVCESLVSISKRPNFVVRKYSGFAINGYRFHTTSRDETRTTQCSGVSLVAQAMQIASAKDNNPVYGNVTYYGRIKEIWELDYRKFTVPVFLCDWVDSRAVQKDNLGFTVVNFGRLGHQSDRFILASQGRQVFYVQDQENPDLSVVGFTAHKMNKYGRSGEPDDMLEYYAPVDVQDQHEEDLAKELEEDFVCTRPDGEGIYV